METATFVILVATFVVIAVLAAVAVSKLTSGQR
jgi:hypothetical protein